MSDETKTPKPGEWWVADDGSLCRIIGTKLDGGVIFENSSGGYFNGGDDWADWHHEPDCDSFDWVESPAEVWPKWYVSTVERSRWYVRRDSNHWCHEFSKSCPIDGRQRAWSEWHEANSECGLWKEVTESEAMARVTPPVVTTGNAPPETFTITPVESPDDWVEITDTHPNHMPRDGVDWVNAGTNRTWVVHDPKMCRSTVGEYRDSISGRTRCRRKDLPVAVPRYQSDVTCSIAASERERKEIADKTIERVKRFDPSAVKRFPIRLLVSGMVGRRDDETWIVFAATGAPDKNSNTLKEIRSDGNGGWFVEVAE